MSVGTLLGAQSAPAAAGASAYSTAVLADSPFRYWKDWSTSPVVDDVAAANLTLVGAVSNVTGPLTSGDTKAGQFDGVDDRGACALNLSDTSVLTVEFFLWWDSFANNDDMAMEFTANTNSGGGAFWVDPNAAAGDVSIRMFGTNNNNKTYTRPSAAAWHHYAIVFDFSQAGSSEILSYLDGSLWTHATNPATGENTGTFANDTLNVMCRNQSALFGAGKMAHLAIFKSALSSGRIAAHWAAR